MSLLSPEEREALIALRTNTAESEVVELSRPNSRKGKPHLSDAEKSAIVGLRANRMAIEEIATRLGRSRRTVQNYLKNVRDRAGTLTDYDWRENMALKSVDAINAGLDCKKDPYKRANLGKEVMKGLGEFEQDGTNVHIQQLINSTPPEFRDRYFITADEDEKPAT